MLIWSYCASILLVRNVYAIFHNEKDSNAYCHVLKKIELVAAGRNLNSASETVFPSFAEDQFSLAATIPFCSQGYGERNADFVHLDRSHQWHDDLQHVLEVAASFALKPGALLASARRISAFSEACHTGLKYMEPASLWNSIEHHKRPGSTIFRQIESRSKGYLGVTGAVEQTFRPVATVEWNALSDVAAELVHHKGSNEEIILPSAHRYLLGGDRFPQSYSLALSLITKALRSGIHKDGLNFLSLMTWKGLGTLQNKDLSLRLNLISSVVYQQSIAINAFAIAMLEFAASAAGRQWLSEISSEEKLLFNESLGEDNPSTVVNSVSLDLLTDNPIRMKSLLSLSSLLGNGDPIIMHILAKLTSSNFLGLQTCNQSWNLMSKGVRRSLWYAAVTKALRDRGSKTTLSDLELMQLAAAGVEEAEWSLSQSPSVARLIRPKLKLLGFSAHRGRVTSQLKLAEASADSRIHKIHKEKLNSCRNEGEQPSDDPRDALFATWNVIEEGCDQPFDLDELMTAQLEFVLSSKHRWMAFEEEGVSYVIASAEALTKLAWMAFFGRGREQNLRDAMVHLSKLSTSSGHFGIIERIYYFIFQCVFTANWLLLHITRRELIAAAILSGLGSAWMSRFVWCKMKERG